MAARGTISLSNRAPARARAIDPAIRHDRVGLMRVEEMREREDFERVFEATLGSGLSANLGAPIQVRFASEPGDQLWMLQPLLNAYYVPDVAPMVRRFLRDSFRYTLVTARIVPQFALGSILATRPGLRLSGRPGFGVNPALSGAETKLVVPGNQRLRVFDFSSGSVQVLLKSGFDPATMRTEVSVRGPGKRGPFLTISRHGSDVSWFEEEIFEGYTLARCPPWISRARIEREAFHLLDGWSAKERQTIRADVYVEKLAERLSAHGRELDARFRVGCGGSLSSYARRLSEAATELGSVTIQLTHGDLQAGNVLLARDGQTVILTDWEHAAMRSEHYDRLVYGLHTRGTAGLAERIRAFSGGARAGFPLSNLPKSRRWRRSALALFLLEDLAWFAKESLAGPYRGVPRGLRGYLAELARLEPNLDSLNGSN